MQSYVHASEELRQQGRSMAQVACVSESRRIPATQESSAVHQRNGRHFLAKDGRSGPMPAWLVGESSWLRRSEWLLTDLARELNMPAATLHRWRKVHWIHARKLPVRGGHWALWANKEELIRLRRLRQFRRSWEVKSPPIALTTPKARVHK